MTLNIFNTFGYLSVVLWLTMLALWALHTVKKPRRWLCHYALAIGIMAFVCAKINSVTHVNRLQIDRSEQIAEAQARIEAARKKAEEERADDVAQIRFAEDDAEDYLDLAGMDDADREYIESFDEKVTPAWKEERKQRSGARRQDDSIEGLLDTSDQTAGMDADALETEVSEEEFIMMPEKDVILANRLDTLNLRLIRWLLLIGVGIVLFDYVRRLNVYNEAYCPLPLPSILVNGVNPLPVSRTRSPKPRRSMPEELAWLVKSGDAFLYLTDDSAAAGGVPEIMYRLPYQKCPVDVMHIGEKEEQVDDDFIFEALWYNRASFVVDSTRRAEQVLRRIIEQLSGRKETRAKVRQAVHVVWDVSKPMPEPLRSELIDLAGDTGWSVMDNHSR